MTKSTENEQLVRRLTEEIWQKRNFDVIDELIADEYVLHDSSMPEPIRGPAAFRQMAEDGADIIDGTIEVEPLFSTDEYVVSRWTQRGTHVGKMGSIQPSNEAVTITGIEIDRIEDGKIAESWQEVNLLNMLMQIGVVDADIFSPEAPAAD